MRTQTSGNSIVGNRLAVLMLFALMATATPSLVVAQTYDVVINNGSYAILNIEMTRVGVTDPGPKARSLLSLRDPEIDWVKLSESMGVPAVRACTTAELKAALDDALSRPGPRLVEAII